MGESGPNLVTRLLKDANNWTNFRHMLALQIEASRKIHKEQIKYTNDIETIGNVAGFITTFEAEMAKRMNQLDAGSSALIQLVCLSACPRDDNH
jgi:hypothetical protein